MGKNKQYMDDYTGDVKSIRKSHKKFRILMSVLCVTGVIAAGSATYVLMNPAQTMTKEGIDEMDPNEDFVVADDVAFEDAILSQNEDRQEEDLDAVPLFEEADGEDGTIADAIPSDDAETSEEAALPGGVIAEETESEPAEEEPALAEELAAAESEAVVEETAAAESEAVIEEPAAAESEAVVEETAAAESEVAVEEPAAESEAAEIVGVSETEAKETAETEAVAAESEVAETEAEEAESEAETEETVAESEAEMAESETQAAEIREKSKDEVYVETEGELLDEKWIDSVGLEVKGADGWSSAERGESGSIEVDADQTLRFRVTYTVQPGTLSEEMRTLIYQIPKEVTSVEESYGEIVDANERVLANYAIDTTGLIRVTFTDEIAALNEAGTKVTCKIEFRTQASNLAK